jgi:hypothetical protein
MSFTCHFINNTLLFMVFPSHVSRDKVSARNSSDCRLEQGTQMLDVNAKYVRLSVWCYKTRVPIIIAMLTILFWMFLINLLARS